MCVATGRVSVCVCYIQQGASSGDMLALLQESGGLRVTEPERGALKEFFNSAQNYMKHCIYLNTPLVLT